MAHLGAIGITTADIARSCSFYRLLGMDIPEPPQGDDHFEITLPGGARLMWDTEELMRQLEPDWEPPQSHRITFAFECDSPAAVDATYAKVLGAGFGSKAEPYDAFWGQRYASVLDPDGNPVHLFAAL